jgi:hypothetical protein
MKLGTENKKALYSLIGLGAVALYGVYSSLLSGPSYPSPSSAPVSAPGRPPAETVAPSNPVPESGPQPAGPPRAPSASGRSDEFKPKLRSKRPEERIDPTRVDPTLRLDLLAKLQEVPAPGGGHNLFLIGPAPPKVELPSGTETKVVVYKPVMGPRPLPPPPGTVPPPPRQPVPINVKYYGWASPSGSERKRAFFLDGDDVIVKSEGDTIKGHYRVVRIGPSSVVVEDVNDKMQQTLRKVEDATV